LKTNVWFESAMARAVIVAVSLVGTVFGGVYTADMDGAGAGFNVPHAGWQLVLAKDKVQLTP
jgi:hypothetical protein